MEFVADFHIHSRYSRATSKNLTLEELDRVAAQKGVQVLGTGDFTHPMWMRELEEELEEAEQGLYKRKNGSFGTRFMLTCEVASIYSKGGSVRRVHTLLFAPSIGAAKRINARLGKVGNIRSDGRPILGLDIKELARVAFEAEELCMVVPAHAWTPWFSVFGSKSGFDSLEEAFEDMAPYIFAIETGLSSDPPMNWRVGALDSVALLSNSDCHSSAKIAREANIFSTELSYQSIRDTIRSKDPKRFLRTLEFFPEEGKYHYDGHRACGISMKPSERTNDICPRCGRPMTVGVLARVEELADREEGFVPPNAIPYESMIPLEEVLADAFGVGVASKRVQRAYEELLDIFETELLVLRQAEIEEIKKAAGPVVAEALRRVRQGQLSIEAGYDGEYGRISILSSEDRDRLEGAQHALF